MTAGHGLLAHLEFEGNLVDSSGGRTGVRLV